jgi:hypothetical protein
LRTTRIIVDLIITVVEDDQAKAEDDAKVVPEVTKMTGQVWQQEGDTT